jgi:hypothetical protein
LPGIGGKFGPDYAPNEASLLRLATAILIEISDEWETGRKYMTVKELIRL